MKYLFYKNSIKIHLVTTAKKVRFAHFTCLDLSKIINNQTSKNVEQFPCCFQSSPTKDQYPSAQRLHWDFSKACQSFWRGAVLSDARRWGDVSRLRTTPSCYQEHGSRHIVSAHDACAFNTKPQTQNKNQKPKSMR